MFDGDHIVVIRNRGSIVMCQFEICGVFEPRLEVVGTLDQVQSVLVLVKNGCDGVVLSAASKRFFYRHINLYRSLIVFIQLQFVHHVKLNHCFAVNRDNFPDWGCVDGLNHAAEYNGIRCNCGLTLDRFPVRILGGHGDGYFRVLERRMLGDIDVHFKLGQNIFGHGELLGELLIQHVDGDVPVTQHRLFGELQISGEYTTSGEGTGPLLDTVTFAIRDINLQSSRHARFQMRIEYNGAESNQVPWLVDGFV
uniref:Uncharacterized protein n=1 Tax=Cacopsylla melanoneura TaxID=428564 RepID=A0A8D8LIX1_9HEMI